MSTGKEERYQCEDNVQAPLSRCVRCQKNRPNSQEKEEINLKYGSCHVRGLAKCSSRDSKRSTRYRNGIIR